MSGNLASVGEPSVCTLLEGNYHFGLGALVNSLYSHGFRGTVWAGCRGDLPPWAKPLEKDHIPPSFTPADGLVIRFCPVPSGIHLTNYKPAFMLSLLEAHRDLQGLFYFDPDIVIRCRWSFFEEWLGFGMTLVQEITNGTMPSDHPIRMQWKKLAASLGLTCHRDLNQYFNAGFVGVRRDQSPALEIWRQVIAASTAHGTDLASFMTGDRTCPIYSADQDALNLTAMVTDAALSTIGPEGMDFVPGGFTMSHAVGSPKPWNKRMTLSALDGRGPSAADHAYWSHTQTPICLYPERMMFWKKLDMLCGKAIGRVIRRT